MPLSHLFTHTRIHTVTYARSQSSWNVPEDRATMLVSWQTKQIWSYSLQEILQRQFCAWLNEFMPSWVGADEVHSSTSVLFLFHTITRLSLTFLGFLSRERLKSNRKVKVHTGLNRETNSVDRVGVRSVVRRLLLRHQACLKLAPEVITLIWSGLLPVRFKAVERAIETSQRVKLLYFASVLGEDVAEAQSISWRVGLIPPTLLHSAHCLRWANLRSICALCW